MKCLHKRTSYVDMDSINPNCAKSTCYVYPIPDFVRKSWTEFQKESEPYCSPPIDLHIVGGKRQASREITQDDEVKNFCTHLGSLDKVSSIPVLGWSQTVRERSDKREELWQLFRARCISGVNNFQPMMLARGFLQKHQQDGTSV